MDNRPGMVFLREDAYELVFTSDNPWLPVRFKDGTTGKLAPVDPADENVVDISLRRGQIPWCGSVWQFLLGLAYKPASRQKIIVVGMISGKTDWKLKSYGKHCSH